jgi:SAM-dependent methyltransferase
MANVSLPASTTRTAQSLWDAEAATFDDEPHHALDDPLMRSVWWDVLEPVVPPPPSRVADLGCGTGSLSVLLAERGHTVVGVDVSPRMLDLARRKARLSDVDVTFVVGDASAPPLAPVDVIVTRHVVWALDDIATALDGWFSLLTPGGRLVLVEGRWHTGAGIPSDELAELVRRPGVQVDVTPLDDPALWGHPLADSRYVLVARTAPEAETMDGLPRPRAPRSS